MCILKVPFFFFSHFPFWCCQDPIEPTKSNQAFHQTFFYASTKLLTVIITMTNWLSKKKKKINYGKRKGKMRFSFSGNPVSSFATLCSQSWITKQKQLPYSHSPLIIYFLFHGLSPIFFLFILSLFGFKCYIPTIHKATYWLAKPVDSHCLIGDIIS